MAHDGLRPIPVTPSCLLSDILGFARARVHVHTGCQKRLLTAPADMPPYDEIPVALCFVSHAIAAIHPPSPPPPRKEKPIVCNGQIVGQPRKRECRQNVRKMSKKCPEKYPTIVPQGLKTQFSDIFGQFLPIWSILLFGDPVQSRARYKHIALQGFLKRVVLHCWGGGGVSGCRSVWALHERVAPIALTIVVPWADNSPLNTLIESRTPLEKHQVLPHCGKLTFLLGELISYRCWCWRIGAQYR